MAYSSKFSSWYIKYVIKKPFLYLFFIILGISIFLLLAINTQVKVNKTYNGKICVDKNKYVIKLKEKIAIEEVPYLYIYINKNKAVYKVFDFSVMGSEILIDSSNNEDILQILNNQEVAEVKLDIPVEKITLLEKIFIKGGKS